MIKLSKRLKIIAELVPKGSKVVDVGCDHAYLSIYLAQKNISSKIYATDINENAYNIAKNNISTYKLNDIITLKLGNGLQPVKKEDIDTVILSGMGSKTIIDILTTSKDILNKINTLIISSNTNLYYLRKHLTKLNYYITKEVMVIDKKIYYTIIKLDKGTKKYTNNELLYGPILLKNKDKTLLKYLYEDIEKQNNIIKRIPKNKIILKIKLTINKNRTKKIIKRITK